MKRSLLTLLVLALGAWATSCSGAGDDTTTDAADVPADLSDIVADLPPADVPDVSDVSDATDTTDAPAPSDVEGEVYAGPFHDPWTVVPTTELSVPRGWQLQRGIIHNHSPFSHDGCDSKAWPDDGPPDEAVISSCRLDVRRGMCKSGQDFVFFTDHSSYMAHRELPEVLMYLDGDTLIEREGLPVANRVLCDDGHQVITAAGTESGMMPIGIEHHPAGSIDDRHAVYDAQGPDAIAALHDLGALVFLYHTEEWPPESVDDWPIDGIEIYNTHRNLMDNMAAAVKLVGLMRTDPSKIPAIELGLMGFFQENAIDLEHWARVVHKKPMVGVMATDAHQNVFQAPSPDGERLDSFRRMMHWFSNYVLVPAGTVDDKVLKQAIKAGRVYGAFHFLGYPEGFDFHAEVGDAITEMGGTIEGDAATLIVKAPRVARLDPAATKPELTVRVLRAADDATWQLVQEGPGDLSVDVGPGVYRAEVRMVPHHLLAWLGSTPEKFLNEYVWVYGNPIYVAPNW